MSDNNNNAKTMYEAVPAAAELNKVPGFDPLKFLRRAGDSMKLDLPYQKLWFRMAHPNGRMRLTAMRITEQMAIFEAKVFLDRSDAEPFSVSVAQQTMQDSRDFVKAAQNEALSQALSDAGFGIQLVSADTHAASVQKAAPVSKTQPSAITPPVSTVLPQEPSSASQKAAVLSEGNSVSGGTQTPQRASENAETARTKIQPAATPAHEQSLPVSCYQGSQRDCLLAAFDSNKKIILVYKDESVVARACLRLTKGSFQQPSTLNFEFADLSKEDVPTGSHAYSEKLVLFLEHIYTSGLKKSEETAAKEMVVALATQKAEELDAVAVLSNQYRGCYPSGRYVSAPIYIYISKSKNGRQYLDSLGGAAVTLAEEQYKQESFFVERAALDRAHAA